MRFALVNNIRTTPSAGLKGSCPACGAEMIAKCGTQRVHHWAHLGQRVCDDWWEPETQWHRDWKVNFPSEWQEVILHDASGEKHIADVRTELGLTIEFQHSHLKPDERASREGFYRNMLWVVDGLRLLRDVPRFQEGAELLRPVAEAGIYLHRTPHQLFSRSWLSSKVPVFFDFGDKLSSAKPEAPPDRSLWCLLPERIEGQAVVLKVSREDFVRTARDQPLPFNAPMILFKVEQWLLLEKFNQQRQAYLNQMALIARHRQAWRAPRRRRF